jgi:Fe-S cluster assembly iron-binding protein IscA
LVVDCEGAGLRLYQRSRDEHQLQLALTVAESPEPTDQIIGWQGSQVFVDNELAPLLEDKTLDAEILAAQDSNRVDVRFSLLG